MPKITCLLKSAFTLAAISLLATACAEAGWQPVPEKMMTRWGRQVTPDNAWREYPRPQFERGNWKNLNGLWDYTITTRDAATPTNWPGKILVPSPWNPRCLAWASC